MTWIQLEVQYVLNGLPNGKIEFSNLMLNLVWHRFCYGCFQFLKGACTHAHLKLCLNFI